MSLMLQNILQHFYRTLTLFRNGTYTVAPLNVEIWSVGVGQLGHWKFSLSLTCYTVLNLQCFLADRTNYRAYVTVLHVCLSSV